MSMAKWKDRLRRFFGQGVCPYEFSFVLESALRRLILSPETLAERLHLTPQSQVLEVGPGPGFFSPAVARRLGEGRLLLYDIQHGMLRKARAKLERAGAQNVGYVQGDARWMPLADRCVDVAFLVAVLGEVPSPSQCLCELHRVLKPDGLLSITEQPGDPDFRPLPVVEGMTEGQGFSLLETYGHGKNYTANFRKRDPGSNSPPV